MRHDQKPTAPQTTELPHRLASSPHGKVYRWLARNGIAEWLPERVELTVDAGAKTITYPSYRWVDGKRGFNAEYVIIPEGAEAPTDERAVPLVEPLTDEVRTAIRNANKVGLGQIRLVEK